jgi:thioredoxin-dependent peroxiredoxin
MPHVPFEVTMRRQPSSRLALTAALLSALGAPAAAQQPAPAATPAPEIGTMAPDFALPGATRYGALRDPVRLSDLRGKTVVLAFFYRARTKG